MEWSTDGADWPNRAASRFVDAGGLRWHVQRMGTGPVAVLIHGTGASTHSWRDLMPLLAADFDCVAFDLPGHAFTGRPPHEGLSLPRMAAAVRKLLDALGVSPRLLVGHSAGAAIAAQLCLAQGRAPAALVSFNGAFLPLPGLPGLVFPPVAKLMSVTPIAARVFAWRAGDPRAVARLVEGTGSRLDARGLALYGRLVRDPVHADAALGMMARWDLRPLIAALPRLAPRLLLVTGERDRAVAPAQSRQVEALVPGALSACMREAGHLAHEERPGEAAALVRGALRDG